MEGKVNFKNTQVSYAISGQGPVVVWLHGFMGNKTIWSGLINNFKENATNVCVDLLGHGKTGSVSVEHSMELQAEAVMTVLNKLRIDKFLLVGHSMGGYVALSILDNFPEKITHLVLLNSTSKPDTNEKKLNRQRSLKIVSKQKDSYAYLGVVNLFSPDSRRKFDVDIETIIKAAQRTTEEGMSAALLGMMNRSSKEDVLKKYEGHKLIISGKTDAVLPTNLSYKEAVCVNAEFVQLPGGHMLCVEYKNQLFKCLSNFFSL